MNVLIVHAHPEPRSFCAALKDLAVAELSQRGHTVVVSDLYEMGFDPVAKASDFRQRANSDYLVYALEQRHALETDSLPPDIRIELEKLLACDLLVLNFPVFWFSVPAILKGWIDRVLVSGRVYGGKRFYDRGGLVGKRALVSATLGGQQHMFGRDAVHGPLEEMLKHLLQGTLAYTGLRVLPPYFAFHVPYVSNQQRATVLEDYRAYLKTLDGIRPLPFPSLADFDDRMRPLSTRTERSGGR